jgi:hypothetical protein
MSKRFAFLATLLVLSTSNFAFADPIALFSSFGPGDSFRPAAIPILGPGYPLSEGDVSPGQQVGVSFSLPGGTFAFTSLDLALSTLPLPGDSRPVDVALTLVGDDTRHLPGTAVLDTLLVTARSTLKDGGSVLSVSSSTHPTLIGGLEYWFVASVSGAEQGAGWMGSETDSQLLPAAIRRVDTDWTRSGPNGAFRLFGEQLSGPPLAPTPEPATVLLVGAGLACLARRRFHHG